MEKRCLGLHGCQNVCLFICCDAFFCGKHFTIHKKIEKEHQSELASNKIPELKESFLKEIDKFCYQAQMKYTFLSEEIFDRSEMVCERFTAGLHEIITAQNKAQNVKELIRRPESLTEAKEIDEIEGFIADVLYNDNFFEKILLEVDGNFKNYLEPLEKLEKNQEFLNESLEAKTELEKYILEVNQKFEDRLSAAIKRIIEKNEDLEKNQQELEQKLEICDKMIKEKDNEISNKEKDIEIVNQKIKEIQLELEVKSKKFNEMQANNDRILKIVEEKDRLILEVNEKLRITEKNVRLEVNEKQKIVEEKDRLITELSEKMRIVEEKIRLEASYKLKIADENEKKIIEISEKLKVAEESNKNFLINLSHLEEMLRQSQDTLKQQEIFNSDLVKKINESHLQTESLNKEIENKNSSIALLNEKIAKNKIELVGSDKGAEKNLELEKKISDLEKNIDYLNQELKLSYMNICSLEDDKERKMKHIQELKDIKNVNEQEIKRLNQTCNSNAGMRSSLHPAKGQSLSNLDLNKIKSPSGPPLLNLTLKKSSINLEPEVHLSNESNQYYSEKNTLQIKAQSRKHKIESLKDQLKKESENSQLVLEKTKKVFIQQIEQLKNKLEFEVENNKNILNEKTFEIDKKNSEMEYIKSMIIEKKLLGDYIYKSIINKFFLTSKVEPYEFSCLDGHLMQVNQSSKFYDLINDYKLYIDLAAIRLYDKKYKLLVTIAHTADDFLWLVCSPQNQRFLTFLYKTFVCIYEFTGSQIIKCCEYSQSDIRKIYFNEFCRIAITIDPSYIFITNMNFEDAMPTAINYSSEALAQIIRGFKISS